MTSYFIQDGCCQPSVNLIRQLGLSIIDSSLAASPLRISAAVVCGNQTKASFEERLIYCDCFLLMR